MLTQKELKSLLNYDHKTGLFIWLNHMTSRARKGALAGCVNGDGYICIGILGKLYTAHRLAFLYMTGEFPVEQADHVNGIRTDNRWINLRNSSLKENTQNRRKAPSSNKSTGILGVTFEYKGWRARIKVDGKKISLGTFSTPEEAHDAYINAKRKYHPGCTL